MRLKRTATYKEVDDAIKAAGRSDRFIQSLSNRHDYTLIALLPIIIPYSYFLVRKICKQYNWSTKDYMKECPIFNP